MCGTVSTSSLAFFFILAYNHFSFFSRLWDMIVISYDIFDNINYDCGLSCVQLIETSPKFFSILFLSNSQISISSNKKCISTIWVVTKRQSFDINKLSPFLLLFFYIILSNCDTGCAPLSYTTDWVLAVMTEVCTSYSNCDLV